MSNKTKKQELIDLYGARCMLTLIRNKELTYHHIEKVSNGGHTTTNNGSVLIYDMHQWLHNIIEEQDEELYEEINEVLRLYKLCLEMGKTKCIEQYKKECVPLFRDKYIKYRSIK